MGVDVHRAAVRPLGRWRLLCWPLVAFAATACADGGAPPGRRVGQAPPSASLARPQPASSPSTNPTAQEPGQGAKIASIAMRTWVYLEPKSDSTKLGYLRAGALVERGEAPAGTAGCEGGWYRIAPRGYVCVGKGASLDLHHPIVQAIPHGPRRGEPTPYTYVISRKRPPYLYFKLPSLAAQREIEGPRRGSSIALFAATELGHLGPPDPIPALLAGSRPLPKPYGAERSLHFKTHRGRASNNSAFGIVATFDWTGRRMGLTTELDLIALDRTRLAPISSLRGVRIEQPGLPAIVIHHAVSAYRPDERGELRRAEPVAYRSGWVLTGKNSGSARGLLETTAGPWLPRPSLRVARLREDSAGFAREGRKWIDVSIKRQMLVAYEGKRPVFATLVSTGRGEMGDPDKTPATVRGTFMIHAKHVSGTMDGDEAAEDAFDLRDVPYIQYFYKGYALHGAYWHDAFGKVRSHGCINLAPADAAWLFEWTEPAVPPGWHGALNLNAGTLVYIHR